MSLVVRIVNNTVEKFSTGGVNNVGINATSGQVVYIAMNDKCSVTCDADGETITNVTNDAASLIVGGTGNLGIVSAQIGMIGRGGAFHVLRKS